MNENKTSCAPADNQQTLWDRIDWTKTEVATPPEWTWKHGRNPKQKHKR